MADWLVRTFVRNADDLSDPVARARCGEFAGVVCIVEQRNGLHGGRGRHHPQPIGDFTHGLGDLDAALEGAQQIATFGIAEGGQQRAVLRRMLVDRNHPAGAFGKGHEDRKSVV